MENWKNKKGSWDTQTVSFLCQRLDFLNKHLTKDLILNATKEKLCSLAF